MKLISFQLKKFSLVTLFFATSLYARATTSSKVSKEEAAQASAHVLKIIREGKCHLPSPRIIKIQDLFTDNRRRFLPSCTIIHVCGDDTGCCDHDDMKCAPLKQEVVTLYFWVLEMTDRGHKRSVESITIKNDTECSCQSMSSPTNETLKKESDTLTELQSLVTSSHMSMFEGRVQETSIQSIPTNTCPPTLPINLILLPVVIFLGIKNFLC